MTTSFRVLILGGYGNFGTIIAEKLTQIPGIEVIIAGRNSTKVSAMAAQLKVTGVTLDAHNDPHLAKTFTKLQLNLVITTIGPFQNQSYHIVEAALSAKIHYIDLADARAFVCGITQFNEQAQNNDLLICSGASSLPGLSSAVVNEYHAEFSRLEAVDMAISSSEKVPGISTLAAVLSYCGKPFTLWKDNIWTTVYGLQNLYRYQFRSLPKKRWLFNCNVPDLELFPQTYPTLKRVTFAAGVGIDLVQLGSWALSWLARYKLFPNPQKIVAALHFCACRFERFGDGLSAMHVTLKGQDPHGQAQTLHWEIVARNNDGPNIPSFAAIALTRKLHNQSLARRGACSCIGLLSLDEYLAELGTLDIATYITRE